MDKTTLHCTQWSLTGLGGLAVVCLLDDSGMIWFRYVICGGQRSFGDSTDEYVACKGFRLFRGISNNTDRFSGSSLARVSKSGWSEKASDRMWNRTRDLLCRGVCAGPRSHVWTTGPHATIPL